MRIAFDIDGTLTPLGRVRFECAQPRFPSRLVFHEPLRQGAIELMHALKADGHEIWIYTTSLRSRFYLFFWFYAFGIRLGGAVNGGLHASVVRGRHAQPSKYPPAFGIDLLVDDSPGVALEGARHGFSVVVVEPDDPDWASKVRAAARGGI